MPFTFSGFLNKTGAEIMQSAHQLRFAAKDIRRLSSEEYNKIGEEYGIKKHMDKVLKDRNFKDLINDEKKLIRDVKDMSKGMKDMIKDIIMIWHLQISYLSSVVEANSKIKGPVGEKVRNILRNDLSNAFNEVVIEIKNEAHSMESLLDEAASKRRE